MKKLSVLPLCLGCVLAVSTSHAVDFKKSKVTQVVNDVQIISAADQKQKSAGVNDVFMMPDILRTGPASRAELVADDATVTRVGANTIFSFDPANRTIDLKQGSLLFHSPHGKGGGTIHTGSATASVLGSTLIVTTTASGGFKVLALEDEAEIKFLNGLKTKLQPGQMTFVLPGGNAISPIIIFRLDDLIGNSQLVKGFSQNLPSMPLIILEKNKQNALIESGGLEDTHKNVGDDADSKTVKVVDQNTLQQALDGSVKYSDPLDYPINSSYLDPKRVFLKPFQLAGNLFFNDQSFIGVYSPKNIFINNRSSSLLRVNLAAFAGLREFDLVAADTLSIDGPVQFDGLAGGPFSISFSLVGGRQIVVANGASIRADVANFNWQSPGDLTFNSATVRNAGGNTSFRLGSDLTFNNSTLDTAASLTANVAGDITLNNSSFRSDTMLLTSSGGSLNFSGSGISANSFANFTADQSITAANSSFNSDSLVFNTTSGSVHFANSSTRSQYLTVNSGDGILIDGTANTFSAVGGNSSASLRAVHTISLNNADFSQFALMNISSDTVNLYKVAFNNTVNIFSRLGTWNAGAGGVNDLGGNTWNGQAIAPQTGTSGNLAGTGITIGKITP